MIPGLLLVSTRALAATTAEICGPNGDQSWLCARVHDLTGNDTAAEIARTLEKPVAVLLIVLGAFVAARLSRVLVRIIVGRLERVETQESLQRLKAKTRLDVLETSMEMPTERRAQRARTIGVAVRSVITIVVWVIATIMIIHVLGIDLGPVLAGAGLAGVALGFGAQSLVRDFLSGFFMIVEDQFGVGDVIDVGEAAGTVEHVSLRTTRIRDVEGVLWYVPNGEVRRVGNKSQLWSRALLDVDVAYDTDIDRAVRVIREVATDMWQDPAWSREIVAEPEVWGVEAFGPDAIAIRLVVQTRPLEQWRVARELRRRLKLAFDDAGIEIPYPQRTVWLRTESPSPPVRARGPELSGDDA